MNQFHGLWSNGFKRDSKLQMHSTTRTDGSHNSLGLYWNLVEQETRLWRSCGKLFACSCVVVARSVPSPTRGDTADMRSSYTQLNVIQTSVRECVQAGAAPGTFLPRHVPIFRVKAIDVR